MAIYNEILAARYARMLQKLFSMKGPVPAKQLAGEIMTTFPLFNGAENRYLEGWERFGLTAQFIGAAAQFSAIRLRNPATSNCVAVVEKLAVSTNAAAGNAINIGLGSVSLDLGGGGLVSNRMDPRGRPVSVMSPSQATTLAAAIAATLAAIILSPNVTYDVVVDSIQEIPILPGDALTVGVGLAASSTQATLFWRERVLEESERA